MCWRFDRWLPGGMARAIFLIVAALLCAGCSAADDAGSGDSSSAVGTGAARATRAEPATPDSGVAPRALACDPVGFESTAASTAGATEVIDDAIVVPTRVEQTHKQPTGVSGMGYFAKAGLGVKLGRNWQLFVPREEKNLRIGWGSPAQPLTAVAPPRTCTSPSGKVWAWYAGGYWTNGPGCFRLAATIDGRVYPLRIGIGARCP